MRWTYRFVAVLLLVAAIINSRNATPFADFEWLQYVMTRLLFAGSIACAGYSFTRECSSEISPQGLDLAIFGLATIAALMFCGCGLIAWADPFP
jgi:hypothetical protein